MNIILKLVSCTRVFLSSKKLVVGYGNAWMKIEKAVEFEIGKILFFPL
jgi:hypothetical protein